MTDFGEFTDIFRKLGITDPYNTESIAASIGAATGQDLPTAMVASLTPQMMKGAERETYQPIVEQRSQTLLQDLVNTMNKQGVQSVGGFAGSSAFQNIQQGARDVFGKGATDVLSEVGKMQAGAKGNIQNIVQSWRDTIKSVKY